MMWVDKRAGSEKLIDTRDAGSFLVGTQQRIEPTILHSGDIAFLGNGPNETFVTVGIEYKTIGDALQCMTNGRLSGEQLPKLHDDYQERWLLLEGVWRGNPVTGLLEQQWYNTWSHKLQWIESKVGSRKFTALEFNSWLLTMQHPHLGGLSLWITPDQSGTVQFISALHSWWTNKEFAEHRSHLHPDNSGAPTHLLRKPKTQAERSRLLVEKTAAQLDGIGWGKAAKVKQKFDTLQQMSNATPEAWRTIEGIGVVLSKRVVRDITGKE